jgi:hypothetical protein
MSFQTTYYFSLLENEFQQLKISQDIAEKEILARNIISRGYYTVLLHCKYVLELTFIKSQDSDTHKRIYEAVINRQVKNFLKLYKTLRIEADYYKTLSSDLINEITEIKLSKFIDIIKNFLSFDKLKLKQSI